MAFFIISQVTCIRKERGNANQHKIGDGKAVSALKTRERKAPSPTTCQSSDQAAAMASVHWSLSTRSITARSTCTKRLANQEVAVGWEETDLETCGSGAGVSIGPVVSTGLSCAFHFGLAASTRVSGTGHPARLAHDGDVVRPDAVAHVPEAQARDGGQHPVLVNAEGDDHRDHLDEPAAPGAGAIPFCAVAHSGCRGNELNTRADPGHERKRNADGAPRARALDGDGVAGPLEERLHVGREAE